jgi:hypothetical protein
MVPGWQCKAGNARLARAASPASPSAFCDLPPGRHATQQHRREAAQAHLAEPSARMGTRPREDRHCRAGASEEHCQVRLSVVSTGTTTVRMGTAAAGGAGWGEKGGAAERVYVRQKAC